MKKTTKGAISSSTIEGVEGMVDWNTRWDCNGKNTPSKEETEREKKLNQRLNTVQGEEEEGEKHWKGAKRRAQ